MLAHPLACLLLIAAIVTTVAAILNSQFSTVGERSAVSLISSPHQTPAGRVALEGKR